jgi:alkylated DNA nucleotide flippase Atl1
VVDPIPEFAAAVLDVVDLIPRGRVMTYGDVAEYLGRGGPRQVGQVMARWGGAVSWWRVLKADGSPPPGHEPAALREYRRERTPLRPDGRRVDLRRARWDGVAGTDGRVAGTDGRVAGTDGGVTGTDGGAGSVADGVGTAGRRRPGAGDPPGWPESAGEEGRL